MRMKLKGYIAVAALVVAPAIAEAQTTSIESMPVANGKETKIGRVDGGYGKGDFSVFGFMDFLGRSFDSFYGELYARQNLLHKTGAQFEINGGSDYGPVYRAGYIADIQTPEGSYMNVKFLPLNITGGKTLAQFQIGIFGDIRLPKGFYLENWTDYTIEKDAKQLLQSEFTAGRHMNDRFSLQGQASYEVGFKGWALRAGARYKLF